MSGWNPAETDKRCPKCGRILPIPEGWQMQVTECAQCAIEDMDIRDIPYFELIGTRDETQTVD